LSRVIQDEKKKLIPDPIELETGRLIDVLQKTFPDQLGKVELSAFLISPSELKDKALPPFAASLVAAGSAADSSPAKAVWKLLSDEQRKQLRAIAAQSEETAASRTQVLAILNSLAGKPALHSAPEFKDRTGADEPTTKGLRESLAVRANSEQSRHLNKLLLAEEFPSLLEPPKVNMIPLPAWKVVEIKFIVLNAQEAFMIWMKAAMVSGLVLGSPWIFYQIWNFVAAGLYPHEKNYVYMYLPISILLFLGGASLAYLFVFDPVLNFLFLFNDSMNAEFDPRIGEWLGFVLILPVGFGIGFQLPLVMLFLNRIGILTIDLYIQQWRIAILSIFIIAMVLTPADPYSMLLMAIPLCFLYVVGILMCKWMPKGRNPFAEAYEP
jgi:sec-independent protein translocase protein TatC